MSFCVTMAVGIVGCGGGGGGGGGGGTGTLTPAKQSFQAAPQSSGALPVDTSVPEGGDGAKQ